MYGDVFSQIMVSCLLVRIDQSIAINTHNPKAVNSPSETIVVTKTWTLLQLRTIWSQLQLSTPCAVKRDYGSENKNVYLSITTVVKVRSSWVPVTWWYFCSQRTFNITNKQNFEIQEFQIIRTKRQLVLKIAICLLPTLFIKGSLTDFRALLRKWNVTPGDWADQKPLADLKSLTTIS